MQIRILKSDGRVEPYLHTKVLGAFNHAMSGIDNCLYAAEQMAEAVTYYLYRQLQRGTLTGDDIHQMILTVLESMGYRRAAAALTEYRLKRKLQRKRIEVIDDSRPPHAMDRTCHWDKSRIAADLQARHNIDRLLARAIASAVEEKVLKMGVTRVRKSLIHQLVIADTESLLEAHRQLAG